MLSSLGPSSSPPFTGRCQSECTCPGGGLPRVWISLCILPEWVFVGLVLLGVFLFFVLVGICWCQCCPHSCCCYVRCPCCPESCCCPQACEYSDRWGDRAIERNVYLCLTAMCAGFFLHLLSCHPQDWSFQTLLRWMPLASGMTILICLFTYVHLSTILIHTYHSMHLEFSWTLLIKWKDRFGMVRLWGAVPSPWGIQTRGNLLWSFLSHAENLLFI